VRRIDFAGREWAAHAQDHWLEFAGNPNFPDYLRITFVAYGRHAANGHARLERGELAQYLVRKDGTLPDRRDLWSSMQKAIRLGYLLPESQALCLVVSSVHVQGGVGDPDRRCKRDHTKRRKAAAPPRDRKGRIASVGADDRRSDTNVGTETGHSTTNVGTEHRRSTLNPSLSSTPDASASRPPHPYRRKGAAR
jgi:hypothetical protein